ncbi:MAG: tetratricopeptide repeat protein [Phycisphaerae bacterium]
MSRSKRAESAQGTQTSDKAATQTAAEVSIRAFVRRHQVSLAALALAAVGGACYANSFGGAFIFDDKHVIVDSVKLENLWPPEKLGAFFVAGMRPVVNASLALNYLCTPAGAGNWQYHAFNLATHIAAGLTLFGVLRRTLLSWRMIKRFGRAATPLALAASAIWLAHPLATQAVTYIVQRAESMMALFYLLTLYCVIRGAGRAYGEGRMGGGPEGRIPDTKPARLSARPPVLPSSCPPLLFSCRPYLWYILAIVACALGMGTKQVMVTAPLVVLLYDRVFLAKRWADLRPRVWVYVCMAGTWAILVALIWSSPADASAGFGTRTVRWWEYAASQPGVIVRYLELVFWPAGQCMDYGWPIARGFWRIVPPAILVAGLLAATAWALRKRPAAGFAGAAFFLVLAPTSSFMPIADLIFEHRMYLPLAAVVALVAVLLYQASGRLLQMIARGDADKAAPWRWSAWTAAAVVVMVLGVCTHFRNRIYVSELTAWGDVVSHAPDNGRAQFNYGNALGHEKRYAEAIEAYHRGLASKVDFPGYKPSRSDFLNNEGRALMDMGDPGQLDRAIALLREAIALQPGERTSGRYYCNLGKALWTQGKNDEAMAAYRDAARVDPANAEAHYSIGLVLMQQGKPQEAIAYELQALQLKPDHVQAADTLGRCLEKTGQTDRAIGIFSTLLQAAPKLGPAHYYLANALGAQGDGAAAAKHFRTALECAGDNPDPMILNNLAWLLATDPRVGQARQGEAVGMAERACRITRNKSWTILDTLAAAYARDGRWDEAVATAGKALDLAQEAKAAGAAEVRARMELYKSRRAFIQASTVPAAPPADDNPR